MLDNSGTLTQFCVAGLQPVSHCTVYIPFATSFECSVCDAGSTVGNVVGGKVCLPDSVIDPLCSTYALSGLNYVCSQCNSLSVLKDFTSASGIRKYCLLTSDQISDC
jgi:hypothetical protein